MFWQFCWRCSGPQLELDTTNTWDLTAAPCVELERKSRQVYYERADVSFPEIKRRRPKTDALQGEEAHHGHAFLEPLCSSAQSEGASEVLLGGSSTSWALPLGIQKLNRPKNGGGLVMAAQHRRSWVLL